MKALTKKDFTQYGKQSIFAHLFIHRIKDGGAICLMPCLEGYCVTRQDKDYNRIGEKTCTNIQGILNKGGDMDEALDKAIIIANKKLHE